MQEIRTPTPLQRSTALKSFDNLVIAVKASAIAIAVMALFFQDLNVIFTDALSNEAKSYILAVPFLFVYLIYRKRKMLRAVMPLENKDQAKETRHLPLIAGILLSATAVLVYWHGSYTLSPLAYHMLALPMLTAGLTLILFNPQTLRQLAFPIVFLLFLMPPPSEILYGVASTLSGISSGVSGAIVNAVGIPSTISWEYGNPTITITRPDGTPLPFTVDIARSGIYSLIGFLIFVIFIAYITRDKLRKKVAMITLGIPTMYLFNTVCITAILVLGYYYGEELALQISRLIDGWVPIFLGAFILLAISDRLFKTHIFASPWGKCLQCAPISESTQGFCLSCGRVIKPLAVAFHRIDAIKLVAVTAAVILLLSIKAPVFALTQAQPTVVVYTLAGPQVSTGILPEIPGYDLSSARERPDLEYENEVVYAYEYLPIIESGKTILIAYIEIASTPSSLHSWEAYLITWKDIQLIQNPSVVGRFFVLNNTIPGQTPTPILYWYVTATFAVNSTSQQKHIELSLVAYPENLEDLPGIENQLVAAGTEIANYWQPIKTWSQVTMLVSKNDVNLAATTSAMLIATMVVYFAKTRRQRKANENAYEKLSKPTRQIIEILQETENQTRPTLDNIKTAYQETIGQPIDGELLLQKLTELEKSQIIRRSVANVQDEPTQVWKTQVSLKQEKAKQKNARIKREMLDAK